LRYNTLGNHKFYNNTIETFSIDGNGNISVPGDLNITGVVYKSSPGFLMTYNANGFFGPCFYYNMNFNKFVKQMELKILKTKTT
jgi:hypothetical protein